MPAATVQLLVTAVAGGAGCAARAWVRDRLLRRGVQPWTSILGVNLLGATAMGALIADPAAISSRWGELSVAAATGLLAGWTTYSAFAADVVGLWLRGQRQTAAALWIATIIGAPAAALAARAAVLAAYGSWR
jgi:CrcB protein